MTEINILEYISVLWRRKRLFLAVFSVVFVAFVVFALNWKSYKSIATIEVAPPEISANVVKITDVGFDSIGAMADLQISRLRQKVLSTNSLAGIITDLNLYPEQRKNVPIVYIAERMRKDIKLELLSTTLANPASAKKASASQLSAIAFTISFKYRSPYLAQQTVNALVSRFLDEDIKERRNTAKKTSEFLQNQIDVLSKSLGEQEKKIAEFRTANGSISPDSLAFNQQASIATSSRMHAIQSEIMSNIGLLGTLRAQLAQTDPYIRISENGELLTTPSMQLKMLKSQYATLIAKYGSKHPDVVKVRRQIKAMEKNLNPDSEIAGLKAKIADVQANLKKLRNTYGDNHPDIISLKRQKTKLNKQLQSLQKKQTTVNSDSYSISIKSDADNPAYLQIVAQIKAAEKKQEALKAQKEEIKKQQEKYINAITENPESEREIAALTRDYDNSIALYRELKAKKLASEINETIEQGRIGQRLTVIDAPELPLSTTPSRKIFVLAGFVFAVICATGSVLLYQLISNHVMGAHHLEKLIGVAPLATIPHIWTVEEKIKYKQLLKRILFVALACFIALIALFSIFL